MPKILLIEHESLRRETHVELLKKAGYEVGTSDNYQLAEGNDNESSFDLIIVAVHAYKFKEITSYGERLRKNYPALPVLLLMDSNVFVSSSKIYKHQVESGRPDELMRTVATMLTESTR